MKLSLLLVPTALTLLALCRAPQDPEPPVSVFQPWDGTWRGTFVGWDPTGVELYRIRVTQTYRTLDDHTQGVTIRDTMPDGTVIEGQGKNTARRNADGDLELRCVVDKSNGDHVEHSGRIVKGPTGRIEVVWYSLAPSRTETFREWVHEVGKTKHYSVHGTGSYGGKLMLMAGDYERVESGG